MYLFCLLAFQTQTTFRILHFFHLVQRVVVCGDTGIVHLLEADYDWIPDACLVDGHNLSRFVEPVRLRSKNFHRGSSLWADWRRFLLLWLLGLWLLRLSLSTDNNSCKARKKRQKNETKRNERKGNETKKSKDGNVLDNNLTWRCHVASAPLSY